jgi:hypothetical protein
VADREVRRWITVATELVDPVAANSWAERLGMLMPSYHARLRQEQEEAARRAQEEADRREQSEALARQDEARRRQFEAQKVAHAKAEQEKQQQEQQASRRRLRHRREQESGHLSPSSARVVAKRKSASSFGTSKSKGEIEEIMSPGTSQLKSIKKEKGKGKGKAPETPETPVPLRLPRGIPKNAIALEVSFHLVAVDFPPCR